MSDFEDFARERHNNIEAMGNDQDIQRRGIDFVERSGRHRYCYNFDWMGLPVIQFPQDLIALQEIIWRIRPDLIIETGIARGGSLVFYASMLELIGGEGRVLGIDHDIRPHNRSAIESHPHARRVILREGSSLADDVIADATAMAERVRTVMVILDSDHTHSHVLEELRHYASLVTINSYLVVLDTVIDDMPPGYFIDRPWGPGNNPRTAVQAFLAETNEFEIDADYDNKLLVTSAPGGYLRRRHPA